MERLQDNFEIRKTTFEDIEELRKMHAQSWNDTYPNEEMGVSQAWVKERTSAWLTPEGIEKSVEHFKGVFDNPDHFHRIATKNGRIIGLVHMSNLDGKQHLEGLYLDKSQHGIGLAQQLMDAALAWSDMTQPITLEVASYNERAKAFYRKYGFVEKSEDIKMFADKIPCMVMERKGDK